MVEPNEAGNSLDSQPAKKKIFSFFSRRPKTEEEKILAGHEAKKLLDKKLVLAVAKNKRKVPTWSQLKQVSRLLSPKEGRLIKYSLLAIVLAVVAAFLNFWFFTLKLVPDYGGEYSEGLLGGPRFVNPILAQTNDVDLDICSLVFSSLLRRGQTGLEKDLAVDYKISEDQKVYTFYLRSGVKWQGSEEELTVDDVLFTFDLIKDLEVGSPLAVSFKGIEAEKIDDYSFKFTLKEPFTPFLSTLTFGILPKYLWEEVSPINVKLADYNLKPVGSGPFSFDSLKKDRQGNIKSFTLKNNSQYYGGRSYLDKITFKFYHDSVSLEQALVNKNVMSVSYLSPESEEKIFSGSKEAKGFKLYPLSLPQYSAVFFNPNNNEILNDRNIRQALYQAVDRQNIITQVLSGGAKVIDSPILEGFVGYSSEVRKYDYSVAEATRILDAAGWRGISPNDYITWQREQEKKAATKPEDFIDRLDGDRLAEIADQEYFRKKGDKVFELTLTVVDQPESVLVAKMIRADWQKIGVRTKLSIISPEDILRTVIRPRSYQALLYGEIIGYDPDPYAFWHSSQTSGTGLNLAVFKDKRVDKYIETARQTNDLAVRADNYKKMQEILTEEVPAVFLYSPVYLYAVSSHVKGVTVDRIFTPADRLSDLNVRYINTKRGW